MCSIVRDCLGSKERRVDLRRDVVLRLNDFRFRIERLHKRISDFEFFKDGTKSTGRLVKW